MDIVECTVFRQPARDTATICTFTATTVFLKTCIKRIILTIIIWESVRRMKISNLHLSRVREQLTREVSFYFPTTGRGTGTLGVTDPYIAKADRGSSQ